MENISNILDKVILGELTRAEAESRLLGLFSVSGSCSDNKHRRHITEKELKLAAKELRLQYGLITHIINKVRQMQTKSDNYR